MSGATRTEFIAYWEREGADYARRGDYDWMAGLVPAGPVLEIGCGPGFGTAALVKRGFAVLTVDSLAECLAATEARVASPSLRLLPADLLALTDADQAAMAAFAPRTVVCWLMGAPADVTGAAQDGKAVAAYRERLHRQVAELAAALPTVTHLHLVDRTAIAWQAKDVGRDVLVRYHTGTTLAGLPWRADRQQALYRKLEEKTAGAARYRPAHPTLRDAVPVLASLLVERMT